ncbi:MAG: ABC transporter substrate-binding protein [Marinibacterium sp.]
MILLVWVTSALGLEIEEETWFRGSGSGGELHIISTTDTDVFAPLIRAYQSRVPGVSIRYVVASSQELFRAVAGGDARFDLAISSAMDLQMKLVNDGHARPHISSATARLPGWAIWRDQLFAFSQEPVVMAVSLAAMGGLPVPKTRGELIELLRNHPDQFAGRIGTYDPRTSGAGYLFASQDARRSDAYWRLSEVMGGLDPLLYGSTGAMIDDLMAGRLTLAYNVLGSYLSRRLSNWPGGEMVALRDYTLVLLRTAFVPISAENPGQGNAFLDFLISEDGQRLIAGETGLPRIDETALAADPHLRPIRLDSGLLVYVDPVKRQNFLSEWTAAVVQR